jgi:glycosyltransferase involved in cell wall biosynthesis
MRVSTIIAAYNAERTIAETLESALSQKLDGHEIIVVNDGSSDSTEFVVKSYRERVRLINQQNSGVARARNRGFAESRGRYVAFLDSDDIWTPDKLPTMCSELDKNPSASLAFSEYTNFSGDRDLGVSSLYGAPSMSDLMEVSLPPILTSTWVLPRESFKRAGGFSEAFKGGQGFEDSWLLLLLRELGEFIYVPARLTRYRVSEDGENADKYQKSLAVFTTLAHEHYGNRAKRLVQNARNLQCRWLLTKAAHQMDRSEHLGAFMSLARILFLRPAYFLGPQFGERMLLSQNSKRLKTLMGLRVPFRK